MNAQFYIGYALFNQGKYQPAIAYFNLAMNNGFDFFYEDAQWFKALAYLKLQERDKAKDLLQKIETQGGKHAKPARKALREF